MKELTLIVTSPACVLSLWPFAMILGFAVAQPDASPAVTWTLTAFCFVSSLFNANGGINA